MVGQDMIQARRLVQEGNFDIGENIQCGQGPLMHAGGLGRARSRRVPWPIRTTWLSAKGQAQSRAAAWSRFANNGAKPGLNPSGG